LTIGRDDNDICLTDDQSISRKHAVLTIQNDKLTIKDTNSRYGTYLNQQNTMSFKATHKLAPNVEHEVKVGDRIRLGRFNNIFEVEYRQYKIVKSSLGTDENRKLEKILSKIGVKVSEEFDESITHLTTSKRTDLTHKLTTALAMYLPVVTIEFWESVLLSFENNNQFPDYKNYIPTIKDRSLTFPARISLDLNPHRKVLFSGKTFVFISRNQENEYKKIIHAAGGKSTNLNDDKFTTQQFLQGNMIVIQPRNDEKISSQSHRNSKSFQSITSKY
jgi:nibrin